MHGTSNCCCQSKDFPGIVGERTLQHESVSQLQKCSQNTSCLHLLENLWCPDRDESTSDVMWRFVKFGLTIGCPGCMAITAGTTALGHSDECWARIEQKMLEDVTGEGAMRLEEAIRRKRARPDDESSRADVAMELAARNPMRPVQYGGSSSSWEARPEPSRRREAEEQLGGDVVRARVQDPQGVVRAAEQAQLQPREELEAALDSICKHVQRVGCVACGRIRCRGDVLAWLFGEIGECIQRAPWCGCGLCGMDGTWPRRPVDRSAGGTLHAERPELVIGSGSTSRRRSPSIQDEREARIQGIKHLNLCCAVYRWQTERGVHFLHEHPWGASSWDLDCLKAVRELPGVVGCTMRSTLVWIGGALAFEGWWLGRTPIDAANWLDDIHE